AQIVEINVDDLSDLGLRSITGKDDILSGNINPRFPGEGGSGGGSVATTDAASFFTYDDAAQPAGSFQAQLAALILQGKATIKARPKVVTVDGRQAIISIVRQVPVAQETLSGSTDRSTFEINFVPVGITLNLKPRVGENNSEVQMQVNAVVSNVETINNVVSGINLQAPELNTREVSTFVRVPNHRSLVLGGLINTETEERTFKTPILGDIPIIGGLFKRTRKDKDRTEIIIIITPHIVEEAGGRTESGPSDYQAADPRVSPKGSPVFDELESVLSQATYLLKLKDIRGIDPVTREPLSYEGEDPPLGEVDDPVFLTLAGVVRDLDLVNQLGLGQALTLPPDWPGPRTPFEVQRIVESFLIGYIIETNRLRITDLVPGRELLIPASAGPGDQETGFVSEKWKDPQLLALAKGTLYDRILQSLRALDFTADGREGRSRRNQPKGHRD
ncbi:MAG TPA: type II and III secretion system protein, partial [bacterium]|nr:type II and III secretion system protein [bacterium]